MKIIIGVVVLFCAALGLWYFLGQDKNMEVDQGLIDQPEQHSQIQKTSDTSIALPKETIQLNDQEKEINTPYPKDEELSNAENTEDVEEDYGEEVSHEDFADFITTALEEIIEEDEATSIAIVSEMGKIVDAQPSHKDEGLRFFRSCLENAKLNEQVKSHCQQELEKRER